MKKTALLKLAHVEMMDGWKFVKTQSQFNFYIQLMIVF